MDDVIVRYRGAIGDGAPGDAMPWPTLPRKKVYHSARRITLRRAAATGQSNEWTDPGLDP